MARLFLSFLICILSAPVSANEVALTFEFGQGPDSGRLIAEFSREDSDEETLLITAVNFGGDATEINGDNELKSALAEVSPHLRGWFVAQQSQELWIGTKLNSGQRQSRQVIRLGDILSTNQSGADLDRSLFELNFIAPSGTLEDIAADSSSIEYASVRQVRLVKPDWARVVEDRTVGWTESLPGVYTLTSDPEVALKRVTFLKSESLISIWLRQKLDGVFISGGIALIVLVIASQFLTARSLRIFSLIVMVACFAIGFVQAGFSFSPSKLLFRGSDALTVGLLAICFALLPASGVAKVKEIVDLARDYK